MSFKELKTYEDFAEFVGLPEFVITFSTTWCVPCKRFRPHFEAVGEKSSLPFGYIYIDTLDPEDASFISTHWGVQAVPDVRHYANGEGRSLISRTAPALEKEING